MKKVIALPLFLFFKLSSVVLEHPILKTIDGKTLGVNVDSISMIKKYQSNILKMITGQTNKEPNKYRYSFDSKYYTLQELSSHEKTIENSISSAQKKQIRQLISRMKKDVEGFSKEFEQLSKDAKPVMRTLIEESCTKRNRQNSLLLIWAQSNESEDVLYDKHIHTIQTVETFLIDIYNFLSDMVQSCPIALKQFKERTHKFGKIKEIIVDNQVVTKPMQHPFLRFCHQFLDKVHLHDITEKSVKKLYNTFEEQHPHATQ